MFLLPSVVLGVVLAVALGGKPARLLDVRLRLGWVVPASLGLQLVIFSPRGADLPLGVSRGLHLGSYALLLVFAAANVRVRALVLVLAGLAANTIAIAANAGAMPLSETAARAAGVSPGDHANVSATATHLPWLGDVFALPSQLPLANVFSVGDLLIGVGMIAFVVLVSAGGEGKERALDPVRILAPLRSRPYRRLAAGKLVSFAGDWLTLAALIGWIYHETSSTGQAALLLLARLAPPVVASSLAALVIDRLPKQRVLVWVEAGRALAVAGALAAVATGATPGIFAAIAVSGALAAVSSAAAPSFLPAVVPASELASANALLGIARDGAMAAGALAAGLALSAVGVVPALALDLCTFAVAFVLFAGLPAPAQLPASLGSDGRLLDGLRALLRCRRLSLLVVAFGTATLATGLTNATLPDLLGRKLGFGASGYGYGIAALAAGLALGGALVGFTRVGADGGRWMGVGLAVMGGIFLLLGLVDHGPTALLIVGAIGFVDGTTEVVFDTVVQYEADPRHLGAVFGFAGAFTTSTMIGAVAFAPLANRLLGASGAVIAASLILVGAGAIAVVGMRRPAAPVPEPALS